ncbi:hypothetical protein [Pelomonas sp. Root1217]|uniref:hypothetical protein n=1 Tax=Pelomonas sp. Root1217 TaxID=1736430 RepID=UPI00070C6E64|nr:hypothetical protein [Pelomonas sp. Root1217]
MRRILLIFLLALAMAAPARAGMFSRSCSDPVVFRGATVNALVLPWRVDVGAARLQAAGRQISSLAHLQLLMGMLPLGSIGAVDLVGESGAICDVDEVLTRVSRDGVEGGTLAPGQAVVVIWGRLFEQDGELFVQTYVRFARQGRAGLVPERLSLNWGGAELQAGLPMQALAFAPRRISLADLARIDAACRDALRVHDTPDAASPGAALPSSPRQGLPYWITEQRGDWLRLTPMRQGLPAGWVRARSGDDIPDWSLSRWLPELDYALGLAGWLRLQVRDGLVNQEDRGLAAFATAALARYEAAVPADQAPAAWGLAAALRGHIAWTQGDRREAAAQFAKARERLPGSAAAANLAAVSALDGVPAGPAAAQRLGQRLLGALALAPDDAMLRANLAALYRIYADKPGWSPFAPAELAERQQLLHSAR